MQHIRDNVPPWDTGTNVTEIQVPIGGLGPDPTELGRIAGNGWIAPNTPGAVISRVWEITWVNDPRGFDVPALVEVPTGGR